MDFIHVRNLEKYHPGYKDRTLLWAKIYFNVVQGDPDCEMITDETDWGRLIKFIILELQAKKPIPLDESYLVRKGFNLKKRPISLTLKMLQNFVDTVQSESETRVIDKEEKRIEEKRVDKEEKIIPPPKDLVFNFFKSLNSNLADDFFNHFESNGWKVGGKTPMKNWHAAAHKWISNDKKWNGTKSIGATQEGYEEFKKQRGIK